MTSVLGLDIGGTAVRGVETTYGKGAPTVTRYGEAPLPPGSVNGGIIQDEKVIADAIRQMRARAKFATRQTVLGVTSPQVVVREMSVANVPPKDLRASLPFQVRDLLPLPVERSVLDFLPLEDPGRAETVRGLLIAAPKEAVQKAVQAAQSAGLNVLRVDLSSLALLRAAAHLDGQVEALVDIGAQLTTVVVHADGVPMIVRTIPRGGGELTAAVSNRLGVPVPEAEALKARIGLWAEKGAEVAEAVREALRPLINEIRGSFAYLSTSGRQTQVSRLVLSGGGGHLPGLPDSLAGQLDVRVEAANALTRISYERPDLGLPVSTLIPAGLTLGAAA
jgi:type IV pilus assembly protein PilM